MTLDRLSPILGVPVHHPRPGRRGVGPRPGPRGGQRAASWLVAALALAAGLGAASVVAAATFDVDTTADDPSLTACDDAVPSDCSLRGAILAANASPGADTINVPAGTYALTISGSMAEEPSATGGLDLTDSVTLVGAGAAVTVIQGVSPGPNLENQPVFDIHGAITAYISGVTVSGGTASGIFSASATLTLADSVIDQNSSRGRGGGISSGGTLTVINSTFRRNGARGPGAAISTGGNLIVRNSTLSGNGGLRSAIVVGGPAAFNNVTIAENNQGLELSPGVTVTLRNTILTANGVDCSGAGTLASEGYNLIGDTTTCSFVAGPGDQVGVNPRLAPLGDYGGPTPTHALCAAAGVPEPSCTAASPAIDAGNPAPPGSGGTACESADQRGVGRPGGPICDIGAFEVQPGHSVTLTDGPRGSPNPVASGGTATLSVTAADSLGHGLTYAWTASCPTLASNGRFADAALRTPSWTAPTNATGHPQSCTLSVTVSDGRGLSALASYAHVVTSSGDPAPSVGPTLTLALNKTAFHPGDTMVLTVTLTPGRVPAPVDVFLVIRLPDGSVYSLQIGGATRGMVPVVAAFVPRPFTGAVVRYTLTGREEAGTYSWLGALTEPGTTNLVGMQELAFTIGL